ncbi:MAG: hypothetical protein OXH02_10410 [Gemmatimonadetes bacterium]|nr:hypothetical protein [Gemmatimonadota bacterium]
MIQAFRALVFAASVSFFTLPASGQFNLNLGGEVARPSSGLADLVEEDYGYGAHAALTYWFSYRVQLVCAGGYVTYGSEKIKSRTEAEDLVDQGLDAIIERIEGNYSSIPVTAGLRFYPLERLFVQGAAGVVYKRTRQMGNANAKEGFVTERDLVVSPGIGLLLGRFSLQAQYNVSRDDWKWMSLGVSMIFGKL